MPERSTAPPLSPDSARVSRRRGFGPLIAVLAALTAVAPFATDMYVPGLPALADSLTASEPSVQLSMTVFLIGLAIGQVLIGPVSDSLGRRRILLAGAAAFAVLSAGCAVAPTIELFNAARFLQGFAGAAGLVVARAVITDHFPGPEAARHFSTLAVITFLAPVLAPVLGGAILAVAQWRIVFVLLAVFGALLVIGVLVRVPESLPSERRRRGGVAATLRAMADLLSRRALVGYVLTLALGSAALFTYIVGSTFVFQDVYGVSPTGYSLIFATNAMGMLAAGLAFGRLAGRIRLNALLGTGIALAIGASGALAVALATVGAGLAAVWIALFLVSAGTGLALPAATTIAQTLGSDSPGSTSALVGGGQFLCGAAAAPLVGIFGTASALPMSLLILTAFGCAGVCLAAVARPWQGHGEHRDTAAT